MITSSHTEHRAPSSPASANNHPHYCPYPHQAKGTNPQSSAWHSSHRSVVLTSVVLTAVVLTAVVLTAVVLTSVVLASEVLASVVLASVVLASEENCRNYERE